MSTEKAVVSSLLSQAIAAVRFATPEIAPDVESVLARLEADSRAQAAVAALAADVQQAVRVVRACFEAAALCGGFHRVVGGEAAVSERLDSLAAAVRDIDLFVEILQDENDPKRRHPLAAYVSLESGEAEYLRIALGRIAGLIEGRRRVAAQTPLRLGATQKWRMDTAGETAALGWLAAAIEKIAGSPHYAHVATLAEIILQMPDSIDPKRVREALRTRRERDWQRA